MKPVIKYACDPGSEAAQDELTEFAVQVAAIIANRCRHVPEKSRREMAQYVSDAIDNALFDIGGRIDRDTFMALSGFAAGGGS